MPVAKMQPTPNSAVSTISMRLTSQAMACRTRTLLNGAIALLMKRWLRQVEIA